MKTNLILEIIMAVVGAAVAVCPYDKIKEFFPKARSKKLLKTTGIIIAVGSIFAVIMEFAV